MTITATADAAFSPPRVQVDVALATGLTMLTVNVWRNDATGRSLVRTQPSNGFESRTVFDYECPYEASVTYDWVATYIDENDTTVTFSDDYADYATGWVGETSDGSVSGTELTLTSSGTSAEISKAVSAVQWDEINIARLECSLTSFSVVYGIEFTDGGFLEMNVFSGNLRVNLRSSSSSFTFFQNYSGFNTSDSIKIVRSGSSFIIRQGSTSVTLGYDFGDLIGHRLALGSFSSSVTVGEVTASTFDTSPQTIAETSSAVQLSPVNAWLVAPQAPALSFALSNVDQQAAGIRNLAPVVNASNTTIHNILGTSTPVTTTTGNRSADRFAATLYTHTSAERVALRALFAPDLPILVNIPPSWDLDVSYGFCQAGDVTESRPYTIGGVPMRDFEVPLTRVRAPDVDVQNPGWSYAQVASVWAAYTDVLNNYDTYADLTVDNRN